MAQKLETKRELRHMGMRASENVYQLIIGLILALIAATMVLPFLYVIIISFTDSSVYVSA